MLTDKQLKFKTEWLRNLRSGEFKQVKTKLSDMNNGRCCLGVACDIATKDDGVSLHRIVEGNDVYYKTVNMPNDNDHYDGILPKAILDEYGIPMSATGYWDRGIKLSESEEYFIDDLTALNDDYGFTFEQIADIIDYKWV